MRRSNRRRPTRCLLFGSDEGAGRRLRARPPATRSGRNATLPFPPYCAVRERDVPAGGSGRSARAAARRPETPAAGKRVLLGSEEGAGRAAAGARLGHAVDVLPAYRA